MTASSSPFLVSFPFLDDSADSWLSLLNSTSLILLALRGLRLICNQHNCYYNSRALWRAIDVLCEAYVSRGCTSPPWPYYDPTCHRWTMPNLLMRAGRTVSVKGAFSLGFRWLLIGGALLFLEFCLRRRSRRWEVGMTQMSWLVISRYHIPLARVRSDAIIKFFCLLSHWSSLLITKPYVGNDFEKGRIRMGVYIMIAMRLCLTMIF